MDKKTNKCPDCKGRGIIKNEQEPKTIKDEFGNTRGMQFDVTPDQPCKTCNGDGEI